MKERAAALHRAVESKLLELEKERPLLAYFQPERGAAWASAAALALLEGREPAAGVYPVAPSDLHARRALESSCVALGSLGDSMTARLLAERALELELDLELIGARGTRRVVECSARRFSFSSRELEVAERRAVAWSSSVAREEDEEVFLVDEFRRAARAKGLELSVTERDIVARAAVTSDGVVVRRGLRLGVRAARRIVVHELEGHYLPRRRARVAPTPLRIGMASGDADEEGRAILAEEREGLLDEGRKLELAVRFRCARLCRQGASALETYRKLRDEGVDDAMLRVVVPRVFRGGGLAREIVYLPALLRVGRALGERPELETAFRSGRASVGGLLAFEAGDPVGFREFLAQTAESSSTTGA